MKKLFDEDISFEDLKSYFNRQVKRDNSVVVVIIAIIGIVALIALVALAVIKLVKKDEKDSLDEFDDDDDEFFVDDDTDFED